MIEADLSGFVMWTVRLCEQYAKSFGLTSSEFDFVMHCDNNPFKTGLNHLKSALIHAVIWCPTVSTYRFEPKMTQFNDTKWWLAAQLMSRNKCYRVPPRKSTQSYNYTYNLHKIMQNPCSRFFKNKISAKQLATKTNNMMHHEIYQTSKSRNTQTSPYLLIRSIWTLRVILHVCNRNFT